MSESGCVPCVIPLSCVNAAESRAPAAQTDQAREEGERAREKAGKGESQLIPLREGGIS